MYRFSYLTSILIIHQGVDEDILGCVLDFYPLFQALEIVSDLEYFVQAQQNLLVIKLTHAFSNISKPGRITPVTLLEESANYGFKKDRDIIFSDNNNDTARSDPSMLGS